MSGIGAYRKRGDHEVVFVFARASAPGGRFSALRVAGRWKPVEFTFGDLEDDFLPIRSSGEVAALVKAARAAPTAWAASLTLATKNFPKIFAEKRIAKIAPKRGDGGGSN